MAETIKNKFKPKVTISGIPVQANFVWSYQLGAEPYITTIYQKQKIAENIYRKANSGDEKVVFTRGQSGTFNFPKITIEARYNISFQEFTKKHENILLLNLVKDRRNASGLIVADIRWLLQAVMVRANYNITWKKPEYQVAKDIQQDSDFDGTLERIPFANEFRDRYRLNKFAYIKSTIKENGEPWECLEILNNLMSEYAPEYWGGFCRIQNGEPITCQPDWSDVATNDKNYIGTPLSDVLEDLLQESLSNCTVFDDGKIYVFPQLDSVHLLEVLNKSKANYTKSTVSVNRITKMDNRHRRSDYYDVGFDVNQEAVFYFHMDEYDQVDENKTGRRKNRAPGMDTSGIEKLNAHLKMRAEGNVGPTSTITPSEGESDHQYHYVGNLINVTSLSYPITVDGVYYESGSYIDIFKLLQYYDIPVKYLLHAFYDGCFAGLIAGKYLAKVKADGREVTWSDPTLVQQYDPDFKSLVNSISCDFLKTFRIDPEVRQHMLSFSANRAAIAQYISNASIHGPVYENYLDFRSLKGLTNDTDVDKMVDFNRDYEDKELIDIVKSKPTPFRCFVDADEIISIDMSNDRRGYHYDFEPGSLLEPANQQLVNGAQNITTWLKAGWFKLAIILNVKWVLPNTSSNRTDGIYTITQKGGLNGTAPTKEIFVGGRTAKFPWRTGMNSLEDIVQSKPINIEELEAFAASYVNILEFQNQDWYEGAQTFTGCFDKLYSFGNCEVSIIYEKSKVSTRIVASAPRTPSVRQTMPRNLKRLYFGEAVEKE